jgi:hypothetical protein
MSGVALVKSRRAHAWHRAFYNQNRTVVLFASGLVA